MSGAIPIVTGGRIATAERSELVGLIEHYRSMSNEWLRRQILVNNRIDILATAILGYQIQPFHMKMLQFSMQHTDNLQLVFRGAGKSTVNTVTKSIWYLLKNPNLRILIASKTTQNSEGFLKEIKGHFETNDRLAEVFGPYYDPRKVSKWDNREIEVLPRTTTVKEASITCVGFEGTIISKHYDVEFSDDLVDEDNSRTLHMRDRMKKWYYSVLDPCMEPPDKDIPERGHRNRLGTRYHYDDLYGHWIANELKEHHQIIPALDEKGRSPWPEKWPPEEFLKRKQKAGLIIFNAQYQCDTEAMKGEVFQYDHCQMVEDSDLPDQLRIYMGVDLAISEKEAADHFAIVVIGIDRSAHHYVLDFYDGQLRFKQQTAKIMEFYERWNPIRIGIETNAYQAAQAQTLKDVDPDIPIKKIVTDKDKVTVAWSLTPVFEDGRMHFRKVCGPVREQLVLFPSFRYKDLFDAFAMAMKAAKMKTRKKRANEPGVL